MIKRHFVTYNGHYYRYKIEQIGNKVFVEFIGGIPQAINSFVSDLTELTENTDPNSRVLYLDCVRFETPYYKVVPTVIAPCMELYRALGYTKIILTTAKPQKCFRDSMEELCLKLGITNFEQEIAESIGTQRYIKDGVYFKCLHGGCYV